MIHKKNFSDLSPFELYEILKLRAEIFVVEQNVVYNDLDDKDLNAKHLFIKDKKQSIIAYLRLLDAGVSYKTASFGRVVVAKNMRKNGFATKMISFAIEHFKGQDLTISAQVYLQKYYESFGFFAVSKIYLEDKLEHIKMTLKNIRK